MEEPNILPFRPSDFWIPSWDVFADRPPLADLPMEEGYFSGAE